MCQYREPCVSDGSMILCVFVGILHEVSLLESIFTFFAGCAVGAGRESPASRDSEAV